MADEIKSTTQRYVDATLIRNRFAETVEEIVEAISEVTVVAKREGLVELMTFLRDEPSLRFNYWWSRSR